ncbi:MAG: pantoate--beta-alanine ligase [Elusimicrobia bacterium HGW-Elusimicrobia-2]|nr:MAG: pantoate--beta-alanine ligase [Elusimicrobia bacterium HGW-Elusimicrobia-2]
MIRAVSPNDAARICDIARRKGKTQGLVPTMGALHEGHVKLIRECRKQCSFLVVSIFVNPAQFGPGEDLASYPADLKKDMRMCRENGVDMIFTPGAADMYPADFETFVEPGRLAAHLCGLKRPGHFRGVATVVLKLFNIIRPDIAVFGKKDYQQLAVIKKMARDLDLTLKIRGVETVRTKSGLAVSSRNRYLSVGELERAALLRKSLQEGRLMASRGSSAADIKRKIRAMLKAAGGRIDYVSVCDRESLEDVREVRGNALIALAVKIGPARLIDNIEIEGPGKAKK